MTAPDVPRSTTDDHFNEVYHAEEKVAPLVRQLSWSHNMMIFGQSKRPEEREFYVRMAVQEKWSKRELERQFKSALFERSVTQPAKVSAVLKQTHPAALEIFRDAYMLEFLELPGGHAETDLHQGLLGRLKDFLIELGRDFSFVGSQYPLGPAAGQTVTSGEAARVLCLEHRAGRRVLN